MADFVFKRYELKYLLSFEQYLAVRAEIKKRLSPDKFGVNTVQSLYLDTDDYRLIRESVEKPVFKEKLRLRCYNLNDCDKDIFVEMKRKYDGVVYKRRIACKERDAENLQGGKVLTSQIGRELKYFLNFYGGLSPKMLILCDREAFYGDGDLRVTFDRNIRYRTTDLDFHTSLNGEDIIPKDQTLMELKTGTALPLWLCDLLCDNRIRKTSFSKYGTAYQLELTKKRSDIICLNQFSKTETLRRSVSL